MRYRRKDEDLEKRMDCTLPEIRRQDIHPHSKSIVQWAGDEMSVLNLSQINDIFFVMGVWQNNNHSKFKKS
jgi:hypothetical protein